jgi:pimeloyl-ACP methyl ester carboxylesterase
MNVYFISGLGADERAFQRIVLPERFAIRHLAWKPPLRGETMNAYARRLARGIDTSQPFGLVGLSFGGMIAVEMNAFLSPARTVLLSSDYTRRHLPFYVQWIGRLRLHRAVPPSWLKRFPAGAHWFFKTRTAAEKNLLNQFLHDADEGFLHWAIDAVLTRKNTVLPPNCIRIHGDSDKVLPHYEGADAVIRSGGHFMVLTKGREISSLLEQYLSEASTKEGVA